MATREEIESLYQRYLNNAISKEELEKLLEMLHTQEGELTISSLIDGTWSEMFEETQQAPATSAFKLKRIWYRVAAAAVVLLLFSVGGYFIFHHSASDQTADTSKQHASDNNDVAPGGNRAVLTLADGTQIILDSASTGAVTQQGSTKIIKLDNGQLAYNSLNKKSGEILYNTISTPKGGQYQIVLADGSKVWLNAASSLRFPASFSGKERKVELTGEGYFEVAKNTSMPFRVNVGDMQVEVLGTHFNVNAYEDEHSVATTLLEGTVRIKSEASIDPESDAVTLRPGEQADLAKDGDLKINHSVNLTEVVAWKDGNFEFNNTPVADIMQQISRWYDVEIDYKGALPAQQLTGKISRGVNLSQLIEMIQYTGVNAEINNKKIIIWEN